MRSIVLLLVALTAAFAQRPARAKLPNEQWVSLFNGKDLTGWVGDPKVWKENGRFDMVPVTSRSMRLFVGLRIQCTQCHDHPFNDDWKQSHFWGVNAFFRQVDAPMGRPGIMMKKAMARNKLELVDNPSLNPKGIVPYERRSGVLLYTRAVFFAAQTATAKGKAPRPWRRPCRRP